MSIKRFVAEKDTTITDAYNDDFRTRAVNSNMGEADSLEVFSLFSQVSSSTVERSRILLQFPVTNIAEARAAGTLPASGSVDFYLRLFNVKHPFSVPRKFTLTINPVATSWDEGYGLDMESYTDLGFVEGKGGYGATWLYSTSGSKWSNEGGSVLAGNALSCYFETGLENLELKVTGLVESWLTGALPNNGLLIALSSSQENGSSLQSYYTKKFSARGSEYYMNRPCIEARWNPSVTDDRNNFFASSNLVSPADNTMSLYFYNRVGGKLKNIYGDVIPKLELYYDSLLTNSASASSAIVTNPLPGVYKAQVVLDTSASIIYDNWCNPLTSSIKYHTSNFIVYQREGSDTSENVEYVCNITNLKAKYSQDENVRMKIFVRERDWQPTVYSVSYNNIENTSIPNLYYKIFRFNDNYTIVDYSTGSLSYSKTSYDSQGNYFELDMKIFEKDYGYGIKLATWDGQQLKEFKDIFKFRVE